MSLSISLTFLSIGVLFHFYYPGNYANSDTFSQFDQALNNSYMDWHPPLMAWTWSILLKITNLTASMFIFHTLLLFISAICWTFIFNKLLGFSFSLFIPFLILSPVITEYFSWVVKDVGFAYYMLLACGVLTLGVIKNKMSALLLATVFFLSFAALGTRLNGIFAIIPIVFFSSWFFFEKKKRKILKSVATTGIVMFGLFSCLHIFNYYFLSSKKCYPFQYIQRLDLIFISTAVGKNYFPARIKFLWEMYKGKDVSSNIIFGGKANNVMPDNYSCNYPNSSRKELTYAWITSIMENPFLYLKLRLKMFRSGLNYSGNTLRNLSFRTNKRERSMAKLMKDRSIFANLTFDNTSFKELNISRWPLIISNEVFYMVYLVPFHLTGGWFWFIFLFSEMIIGIFFVQDKNLRSIILLLSLSGILYLLPYYIILPVGNTRYIYWSVISGTFCFFFLFKGLRVKNSLSPTILYPLIFFFGLMIGLIRRM